MESSSVLRQRSRGSLCHSARGVMHTKDNRSPKSGKRPTPLDSTVVAASMLRNFLLFPSRPFFPLRPKEKLKKGGRARGRASRPRPKRRRRLFPSLRRRQKKEGEESAIPLLYFPLPALYPCC